MSKIFCVLTVARQVDGEYTLVKTEKAFKQAGPADVLMRELNDNEYKIGEKFKPVKISTPSGDLQCHCVAGAFEIELVD